MEKGVRLLEAWGPYAFINGEPPDVAGKVLESDGRIAKVQEPNRETATSVNLHGGWTVCRISTNLQESI